MGSNASGFTGALICFRGKICVKSSFGSMWQQTCGPAVLYKSTHWFSFGRKILGEGGGEEVLVKALYMQVVERCGSCGKEVLLGSTEVSL